VLLLTENFVMKTISRTITGAVAAVLLVTAVASPAEARDRRYDRRGNGISLGDVVLGTIAVVGVATAVGALSNGNRNSRGYEDRRYGGYGNDQRASVEACAYEAEREAGRRFGGSARVRDIDDVDRSGRDGYRIRGTIEVQDRYGNKGYGRDRYDRGSERVQFACTARNGRVTGIRVGGDRDYAYGY